MPFARAVTDCHSCPLGVAAGRDGCPFAPKKHGAGRRLVARGRRSEQVTFIKRGYGVLSAGPGQPHALRAPRSIVGWESLTSTPATHTLTTLTETETCTLDADRFRAFAKTRAAAILLLLVDELAQRDCEARYTRGTARQRLARFLVARLQRGGAAYPLELEYQSLARVLGLRPETLSRVLRDLRTRGIVARGRGLFVKDVAALEQIAAI